jgi:non-lysosomal glucosylceramidase
MSESPCSPSSGCCIPTRRDFLRFTGLGTAALLSPRAFAGPFAANANAGLGLDSKHPVPLDKKLSAAWLASLTARGKPSSWKDWAALEHIGMPVAGIGTGTVYLGGDGRLWGWDIFNVPHEGCIPNNGTKEEQMSERNGANYINPSKMESPWNINHGLVIYVDGKAKRLDHSGFPQVEFTGQYPIGNIKLNDPSSPISVEMETFSPFIPLDYDNSSLPVTIIEITLKNSGETAIKTGLEAYLENAASRHQPATSIAGLRRFTRVMPLPGGAMVMGEVRVAATTAAGSRPDIKIADFETKSWEKIHWKAEGDAFTGGPIPGTLPYVKGQEGTSYAHSSNDRLADKGNPDDLTGTLTSPPFKAARHYLTFLLAGGNRADELAVEILLDNKIVHTVTGSNSNQFTSQTIDLTEWQGKELRLRLTDKAKGEWGSIGIDQVILTDENGPAAKVDNILNWGSMALAIIGDKALAQATRGKATTAEETPLTAAQEMAVRAPLVIPAKGEIKTTVIISWHFPGLHPEMAGMPEPRRWVSEGFADAAAVASYTVKKLPHLSSLTHAFRDTWYGSETGANRGTLPHWLLERSLWTVSTLTTNGTYRMTKGRVWGWEGTGCCPGTCTHVWHYAQTAGRLFPQLEIDLRERTDFTPEVMNAAGSIKFRGTFIHEVECIDGQAGIILRCYREHLNDPTGGFLKRNWQHIEKATNFLTTAEAEGKAGGNDGIFTRRFENTLDAKWGGEIPWIVGMYLAGLTAAAAMADDMGSTATAAATRWRAIIAKGRAAYAGYFDKSAGMYKAKCTEAEMLPVHVGPGSHIDMCLGDFWLAQVGLPPIGDKAQLRQAMDSLYKYNFAPDMGVFREKMAPHSGRYYALAGEGGLVMATWPHGGLPEACKGAPTFDYFQECMSGFEHAAAALMVSLAKDENDPLLTQGLTVCRAVHDRYNASRRNPYNEIECSDHYARAMSSYGVFIAATGFHCHAKSGLIRFAPKLSASNFAGPFIGAGAWGKFAQKKSASGLIAVLAVRFGSLRLSRLELIPAAGKAATSTVTLADKALGHRVETRGGYLTIILTEPITLTLGQTLKISV